MNKVKTFTLIICGLSILSGCASNPPLYADDPNRQQETSGSRLGSTVLAIGGILLVGAIVAHEARDGAQDAVRSIDLSP